MSEEDRKHPVNVFNRFRENVGNDISFCTAKSTLYRNFQQGTNETIHVTHKTLQRHWWVCLQSGYHQRTHLPGYPCACLSILWSQEVVQWSTWWWWEQAYLWRAWSSSQRVHSLGREKSHYDNGISTNKTSWWWCIESKETKHPKIMEKHLVPNKDNRSPVGHNHVQTVSIKTIPLQIRNALPKVQHVATGTKLTTGRVFAFQRDWTWKGRKDPPLAPSASRVEVLNTTLKEQNPSYQKTSCEHCSN